MSRPTGLFEVTSHDSVNQLEARGILATNRTPQRLPDGGLRLANEPFPRRVRRHELPPGPGTATEVANEIQDVLIAELAGPGRWGQAAFPQWFIDNFFQVLPDTGDVLNLWPVTRANGVGVAEQTPCGYKAGSRNWYYELGLAAAIGAYPQPPRKPIGVFHRIGRQTCRYTILMPDDESYPPVSACLAANRDQLRRPRNELPRTVVPAVVLWDAWPGNWFFEV